MPVERRQAVLALLDRSRRDFVPIRRAFVQSPRKARGAGPLAAFSKRELALDLYLLVRALSSREPWDTRLSGRVWARLLGLDERATATPSLLSRQWAWLVGQKLVLTERAGQQRRIIVLREDGSGQRYTHPGVGAAGSPPEGNYFRLPHAYWAGAYDERLTLAGKTVLLIALSLQDDFILPLEYASRWYGIGVSRLHRGLRELRAMGLLEMRVVARPAPLTDRGVSFERRYTLRPPFRMADLDEVPVI